MSKRVSKGTVTFPLRGRPGQSPDKNVNKLINKTTLVNHKNLINQNTLLTNKQSITKYLSKVQKINLSQTIQPHERKNFVKLVHLFL